MTTRLRFSWSWLLIGMILLLLLALVRTRPIASAQPGREPIFPQEAALLQLQAVSDGPTHLYFVRGFPVSVVATVPVTGADPVERAQTFLRTYRDLYLQEDPNLNLLVRTTRGGGDEVVVFDQFYKDLPIFGAKLVVLQSGGRVYSTTGALLAQGRNLEVTPAITLAEAEAAARAALGQPNAPVIAPSRLMVFDRSLLDDVPSELHLVWRVLTAGVNPYALLIDAHTGNVLLQYSLRDAFSFDLQDANGMNSEATDCYWWTDEDDEIGDDDGVYEEAQGDADAVAAFAVAQGAYNFYLNTFGRDSYDNDDGEIEVYVHASPQDTVALWQGGTTDCDLIEMQTGAVSQDIFTHEFTHGVIQFSSGLIGVGQPGALNESFGDIMAALQEQDWEVPTGTTGSLALFRSGSNPPDFGSTLSDVGFVNHPDKMSDFVVTSADDGGEHVNNGIPNKAAFLVTEGGTHNGITISGLGYAKARKLYYFTLISLSPWAQFIQARNSAVAWAQLFASEPLVTDAFNIPPFTAFDVCQVRNAYAAVELGNPDLNCDGVEESADVDQDGVPIQNDNCPNKFNPEQDDHNGDGEGNFCDPDFFLDPDGDGVLVDNCPNDPNPDQTDANFNGVGAVCDPSEDEDFDDDGIPNDVDNCLLDENTDQADVDHDGDGDACDPDLDQDGTSNDDDNCINIPNSDQANADGDALGDACDQCPADADYGVSYTTFEDPITGEVSVAPQVPDSDGDGVPDACDNTIRIAGRPEGGFDNHLQPDCNLYQVRVLGDPRAYRRIPIVPERGDPPVWYPADYRLVLTLEGLPDEVRVWVLDDDGMTADEAVVDGDRRTLRWRPQGGQRYFLVLAFSPHVAAAQEVLFESQFITEQGQQTVCRELEGRAAEATTPTASTSADVGRCTATPMGASNVNIRMGPSTESALVGTLPADAMAVVIGKVEDGSWWQVNYAGVSGWVAGSVTEVAGPCDALPVTGRLPALSATRIPEESGGAGCGTFRLDSPRDGLANAVVTFFWTPVGDADRYRVNVYGEGGTPLLASFETPAPNTSVMGDLSTAAIGEGFVFEVEVQALASGVVLCSDRVRQLREVPPPNLEPVCGNRVCEPRELGRDRAGRTCTFCAQDCPRVSVQC